MLQMDPVTRSIQPTEFEGVKLVSFGWAGQGSAIMRRAHGLRCAQHSVIFRCIYCTNKITISSKSGMYPV